MTVPPNPQTAVGIIESKINKDNTGALFRWCSESWRLVLAELVATAILILMGCMTCIPIDGIPYQDPMYPAFGFGFIVTFNIIIFGHISGAHMNPAVSLAALLWGSLSIPLFIAYFIAQCIGSFVGYGILMAVSPIDMVSNGICTTQLRTEVSELQGLGIEIALTGVLHFVNGSVWDPVNKLKIDSTPLKFGFTVIGLSLAGAPLTGASLNPARTLGPAIWTGTWKSHWVYWAGPAIGSVVPTLMYKYIWLAKEHRLSSIKPTNKKYYCKM